MSTDFDEQPTEDALRSAAESYISKNKIGVPSVSLSVSFAQLSKSSEYPFLDLMERVSLFDIVSVDFPKMNVSATAKVVRVVYDVILERFKEITLGEARKKYTDWVFERLSNLEKNVSKLKNKIP
jgi:phage minor structural protein